MKPQRYHGPASHYFHMHGRPCRVVTQNASSERILSVGTYDSHNNERFLKEGSRLRKKVERYFVEIVVPAIRRTNAELAAHPSVRS